MDYCIKSDNNKNRAIVDRGTHIIFAVILGFIAVSLAGIDIVNFDSDGFSNGIRLILYTIVMEVLLIIPTAIVAVQQNEHTNRKWVIRAYLLTMLVLIVNVCVCGAVPSIFTPTESITVSVVIITMLAIKIAMVSRDQRKKFTALSEGLIE